LNRFNAQIQAVTIITAVILSQKAVIMILFSPKFVKGSIPNEGGVFSIVSSRYRVWEHAARQRHQAFFNNTFP